MPTSDANWVYNATTHRWIPTIDGCSSIDDITQIYGDEAKANRNLKSISDSIYNWVYGRGHSQNKAFVEYMFAFDLADVVKEAILAQVEADISSGYNDLKNQHGTNVETGMNMDDFTQKTICIASQQILMSATFIVGSIEYPIIAQYQFGVKLSTTRYTESGY